MRTCSMVTVTIAPVTITTVIWTTVAMATRFTTSVLYTQLCVELLNASV